MYRFSEDEDGEHECMIWRFMIDEKHQNTAMDRATMPLLIAEIKSHKSCEVIEISYG